MNQSNKSIIWSLGTIIISFCVCFAILYFSKVNCITYVKNGETKVDICKVSSLSSVISICLGICVFILLLGKDNTLNLSTKPVVFKPIPAQSVSDNSWSDPI